ncbi:hypothetical protein [Mesorhizobium sp. M0159]|uniref:hypothetical protein n=1 Tax=Mesorhizobium sp. M0159 TaxID=2956900 RepID=UPI00333BC70C
MMRDELDQQRLRRRLGQGLHTYGGLSPGFKIAEVYASAVSEFSPIPRLEQRLDVVVGQDPGQKRAAVEGQHRIQPSRDRVADVRINRCPCVIRKHQAQGRPLRIDRLDAFRQPVHRDAFVGEHPLSWHFHRPRDKADLAPVAPLKVVDVEGPMGKNPVSASARPLQSPLTPSI